MRSVDAKLVFMLRGSGVFFGRTTCHWSVVCPKKTPDPLAIRSTADA